MQGLCRDPRRESVWLNPFCSAFFRVPIEKASRNTRFQLAFSIWRHAPIGPSWRAERRREREGAGEATGEGERERERERERGEGIVHSLKRDTLIF